MKVSDTKRALIDGDVIVYWAANHAQTNCYDITNSKGEVLATHDSKRHANSGLEDLMAFSQEELKIETGEVILSPWRVCEEFIDKFLIKIMKKAKCDSFEVHLSGTTNFRKEISITKPYKGNRSGARPFYYQRVREYLLEKYEAILSVNEEADDTLAIAQMADIDGTVICTVDKDLWMVTGGKYDFKREEESYVTEYDGFRAMQYQMLVGDRVDNIQGVPKVGAVTAKKVLDANEDIDNAWVAIAEAYKKAYGDDYKTVMIEMGRLLWMRREVGEMWDLPQIIK